jgi:hypothetical protein
MTLLAGEALSPKMYGQEDMFNCLRGVCKTGGTENVPHNQACRQIRRLHSKPRPQGPGRSRQPMLDCYQPLCITYLEEGMVSRPDVDCVLLLGAASYQHLLPVAHNLLPRGRHLIAVCTLLKSSKSPHWHELAHFGDKRRPGHTKARPNAETVPPVQSLASNEYSQKNTLKRSSQLHRPAAPWTPRNSWGECPSSWPRPRGRPSTASRQQSKARIRQSSKH